MSQLLAPTVAMLVYPGLVLAAVVGVLAEIGVVAALPGRGRLSAASVRRALAFPTDGAGPEWLLALLAVPVTLLAAAQLAAPFNPLDPNQRNVAVAAIAVVAAAWIANGSRRSARDTRPRVLLIAQACWLVAVLAPALVVENLRPQVLGAIAVPVLRPLKVMSALLYLLCLPVLLQLVRPAGRVSIPRTLSWLPVCGLFASVSVGPVTDDLTGLVRFLAVTAAAAVVTVAAGSLLARRPVVAGPLSMLVLPALAGLTLAVAVISAQLVRS